MFIALVFADEGGPADAVPPPEPAPPAAEATAPAPPSVPAGDRPNDPTPPVTVHWSEVQTKVRVWPEYPAEAVALNLPETLCTVDIRIDPEGVPTQVVPMSCPEPFIDSAVSAAMKWRFYPVTVAGEGVPVRFVLTINYKPAPESGAFAHGGGFLAVRVAANATNREDLHVDPLNGELSVAYGFVRDHIVADVHAGYEGRGATLGARVGMWLLAESPVSPVFSLGHGFGFTAASPIYTGLESRFGVGLTPGERFYAELAGGVDLRVGLAHYAVVVPNLSFQLGTRLGG